MGENHLHIKVCLPSCWQEFWYDKLLPFSVAAATGGVIGPQYASSKSALHGLIHWLSLRYCKEGIVSPGFGSNQFCAHIPHS